MCKNSNKQPEQNGFYQHNLNLRLNKMKKNKGRHKKNKEDKNKGHLVLKKADDNANVNTNMNTNVNMNPVSNDESKELKETDIQFQLVLKMIRKLNKQNFLTEDANETLLGEVECKKLKRYGQDVTGEDVCKDITEKSMLYFH